MPEEKIVFKGSPSPVVNLGTFLLCAVGSFFLMVCIFLSWNQFSNPAIRYGLVILLLVPVGIALGKWALLKARVYEVTTERLKVTDGIFSKKTEELELYRVKDTTLVEPFFLRIFGAGNIVITTADASSPTLELEGLKGAKE
jgi:uncharacterized membrane protein YdbT with pleckstrin-like domain